MKILFVAQIVDSADGGQVITRRNLQLLELIFGADNVEVLSFDANESMSIFKRLFLAMRGFLGDFTPKDLRKLQDILGNDRFDYVFLDNSLLGICCSSILKANARILTFFHNVEFDYFRASLLSQKKPWHLLYWLSAKQSEKILIAKSAKVIGLNRRDSERLRVLYYRSFDLLLPTSFRDAFDHKRMEVEQLSCSNTDELSLLFVGSAFFANIHGLEWFLKDVFPFLKKCKLRVIGSGFENLRERYSLLRNVEVVGRVDDLHIWYSCADVVISPIFRGSGMKTKIAEALMHGKMLLATHEAMAGYCWDGFDIGLVSDLKESMIDFLNQDRSYFRKFNIDSRRLFESKYSIESSEDILRDFFLKIETH